MDIQLKRGILDVCVLAALFRQDSYGYQIIKDLSGRVEVSESTLYPHFAPPCARGGFYKNRQLLLL